MSVYQRLAAMRLYEAFDPLLTYYRQQDSRHPPPVNIIYGLTTVELSFAYLLGFEIDDFVRPNNAPVSTPTLLSLARFIDRYPSADIEIVMDVLLRPSAMPITLRLQSLCTVTGYNIVLAQNNVVKMTIPGSIHRVTIGFMVTTEYGRIVNINVFVPHRFDPRRITSTVVDDKYLNQMFELVGDLLPTNYNVLNSNKITVPYHLSETEKQHVIDAFPNLDIEFSARIANIPHPVSRSIDMCFNKCVNDYVYRTVENPESVWDFAGRITDQPHQPFVVQPISIDTRDAARSISDHDTVVNKLGKANNIMSIASCLVSLSRFDVAHRDAILNRINHCADGPSMNSTIYAVLRQLIDKPICNQPITNNVSIEAECIVLRHVAYNIHPEQLLRAMANGPTKVAFVTMHYMPAIEICDSVTDKITNHILKRDGKHIIGMFRSDFSNCYRTSLNNYLAWVHLPASITVDDVNFYCEMKMMVNSLVLFSIQKVSAPKSDLPRPLYGNTDTLIVGVSSTNEHPEFVVLQIDSSDLKSLESSAHALTSRPTYDLLASLLNSHTYRIMVNKTFISNKAMVSLTTSEMDIMKPYLDSMWVRSQSRATWRIFRKHKEYLPIYTQPINMLATLLPVPVFKSKSVVELPLPKFVSRFILAPVPFFQRTIYGFASRLLTSFKPSSTDATPEWIANVAENIENLRSPGFDQITIEIDQYTPLPMPADVPVPYLRAELSRIVYRVCGLVHSKLAKPATQIATSIHNYIYPQPYIHPDSVPIIIEQPEGVLKSFVNGVFRCIGRMFRKLFFVDFFTLDRREKFNAIGLTLKSKPLAVLVAGYITYRVLKVLIERIQSGSLLCFDRRAYIERQYGFRPHHYPFAEFIVLPFMSTYYLRFCFGESRWCSLPVYIGVVCSVLKVIFNEYSSRRITDHNNLMDKYYYDACRTTNPRRDMIPVRLRTYNLMADRYHEFPYTDENPKPVDHDRKPPTDLINQKIDDLGSFPADDLALLPPPAQASTPNNSRGGGDDDDDDDDDDFGGTSTMNDEQLDATNNTVESAVRIGFDEIVPTIKGAGIPSISFEEIQKLTSTGRANIVNHVDKTTAIYMLLKLIHHQKPNIKFVLVDCFGASYRVMNRLSGIFNSAPVIVVDHAYSREQLRELCNWRYTSRIEFSQLVRRADSFEDNIVFVVNVRDDEINSSIRQNLSRASSAVIEYSKNESENSVPLPFQEKFSSSSIISDAIARARQVRLVDCYSCNIVHRLHTDTRLPDYVQSVLDTAHKPRNKCSSPKVGTSVTVDLLHQNLVARLDVARTYMGYRDQMIGPKPERAYSFPGPIDTWPWIYLPKIRFGDHIVDNYNCVADYLLRESSMVHMILCQLHEDIDRYKKFTKHHEPPPFETAKTAMSEYYYQFSSHKLVHYSTAAAVVNNTGESLSGFYTNDELKFFYPMHILDCNWARRHVIHYRLQTITHFDGIAGCGKTTKIKELISCFGVNKVLVVTQSKAGAREISPSTMTMGGFLQNVTKLTSAYDVAVIDEAAMMHPGQIILFAAISGVRHLFMFGDSNQINFINRDSSYTRPLPSMSVKISKVRLDHTYRCPLDALAVAFDCYQRPLTTSNNIKSSIRFLERIQLNSLVTKFASFDLILCMTQLEKKELVNLCPKLNRIKTVHEAQGASVENVLFVRTQTKPLELFKLDQNKLNPHMLVAVTRHTKQFVYATVMPKESDSFASIIQQSISRNIGSGVVKYVPSHSDELTNRIDMKLFRDIRPGGKVVFHRSFLSTMAVHRHENLKDKNILVRVRENPHQPLTIFRVTDTDVITSMSSDVMKVTNNHLAKLTEVDENTDLLVQPAGCQKVRFDPWNRIGRKVDNLCWWTTFAPLFRLIDLGCASRAAKAMGFRVGDRPVVPDLLQFIASKLAAPISTTPCCDDSSLHYWRFTGQHCTKCLLFKLTENNVAFHVEPATASNATHAVCYRVLPAMPMPTSKGVGINFNDLSSSQLQPKFDFPHDLSVSPPTIDVPNPLTGPLHDAHTVENVNYGIGQPIPYDVVVEQRVIYPNTQPILHSPISFAPLAQIEYDRIAKSIIGVNTEFDYFINSHVGMTDVQTSNVNINQMKLYKPRKFVPFRNPSIIKTNWYPNNKSDNVTMIQAINERNWNVPKLQGPTSSIIYSYASLNRFIDTYLVPDARKLSAEFQSKPIVGSKQYVDQWLSILPKKKRDKYLSTNLALNQMDFKYTATLKTKNKSTGEATIDIKAPKGQVINAMDTCAMFHLVPVIREATDRLRMLLKPQFLMAIGYSEDYMNRWINHYNPPVDSSFYEIDFSAFDKSIGPPHLQLFIDLLKFLGVEKHYLDLWYYTHVFTKSRTMNGISWYTVCQTKSGDPATAFSNTFYSMSALAELCQQVNPIVAMFMGDDSLFISSEDVALPNFDIDLGIKHGFQAKLMKPKAAQFCGYYLVNYNNTWRFVTDPIKRFEKLGCQDNPETIILGQQFIGLQDRCQSLNSYEFNVALDIALQKRYSIDLSFSNLIQFVYSISTNPVDYFKMFGLRLCDRDIKKILSEARKRNLAEIATHLSESELC
uniref:Polyprotein n=1 Tax=Shenzhen toga-like virus TaxID=2789617 RepID=A0A7T1LYR5_9VIRU|nr:polyprotein [Shenzhen toga-like virus]